jgi:hypothetical protein
MKSDLLIAVISALVALISAGISVYSLWLGHQLEKQKRRQIKEELAEELLSRYRDPLLYSAFDLQSRLFNIINLNFFNRWYVRGTAAEKEYAVENTLYVIAEYLGWVEIFRRDIQFLDLGVIRKNHLLVQCLNN